MPIYYPSPFYTGDPYPVSPIIRQVVELFADSAKICRHSIAQDKNKQPCMPNTRDKNDKPVDVAWSLVGALYKQTDDTQMIYNILWKLRYYLNGINPVEWFADPKNTAEYICFVLNDYADWADFWSNPDTDIKM